MKRTLAPALAALVASLPAALVADDNKLTIKPDTFIIHQTITASAFPSASVPIVVAAESWPAFEITSIAAHGATVKKGDVLLGFDPEGLTQALDDLKRTVQLREHEIAAARLALTNLRETAEERLAAARSAAEQADDDHKYYINTRLAVDTEAAEQAVKRAEQRLANANEELVQLKRMYEADDLVEETEEIILTRAREAVETAEFFLRVERLDKERRVETALPRQIESLLEKKNETARKLATDAEEIPRAITLKETELLQLETTQQREAEKLTKLDADRKLLEITAPADGIFYHGVIEDGEWTTPAELLRTLVVAGSPPVKRALATFIPDDAELEFHAMLTEATARSLGDEKPEGLATLTGRGDISIPVALASIAPVPTPALRHHAVFTAEWPEGMRPAAGATAKIHLITYAREDAISVPAKALAFGTSGWEVEVKLADGKTQKRAVTRGRASGDQIEILAGLEPGQVIVLP